MAGRYVSTGHRLGIGDSIDSVLDCSPYFLISLLLRYDFARRLIFAGFVLVETLKGCKTSLAQKKI
jgi:hypothetical protein